MIEGIHKGGVVLMDHGVKVGERKEWKTRPEWVVDKRKGGWDKGFHEVKNCSGGDARASYGRLFECVIET